MVKDNKKTTILAPAKINLYLHIIDKLPDNYHMLDSMVDFVDIGDILEIEPAEIFSFNIKGEFAHELQSEDISNNMVIRAINILAKHTGKAFNFKITLTKNLPIASGIGGGSSDAAAVIWGLMDWWKIPSHAPFLKGLILDLGTDVPVCLKCKPSRMQGLGDIVEEIARIPETPIILVNNGEKCPTPTIYKNFNEKYKKLITIPEKFNDIKSLTEFLNQQSNDLTNAAIMHAPSIKETLKIIKKQPNCLLSRMSGSGATCFGLFDNMNNAVLAANTIKSQNPKWWVKTGWLGRPERY